MLVLPSDDNFCQPRKDPAANYLVNTVLKTTSDTQLVHYIFE